MTVKGMLIPADLITSEIRETREYKDYVKEFDGVSIPMIQPQPIESTQGSNRTPNPVDDVVQKKKRKRAAGGTSSPIPSLKIRVRQQMPIFTTPIPPLSDDRERDEIHEATQLSLALHKAAKLAEEQENVAAVEEQLLKEVVEKIFEGEDKESYANEFADLVFLNEEDSSTMIEPGSHKENPETVDDDDEKKKDHKKDDDDDDDNDDHNDHALIRTRRTGSSKVRTEKMQTPIPSPPRSPRKDLYSDKAITKELVVSVTSTPTPATSSQRRAKLISKKYSHIPGALHKICKCQDFFDATNDLIADNLPRVMADAVKKEREALKAIVPALISKEFVDHAPKIIKELFKIHMKNNVINIHPTTNQVADPELWDVLKRKFEKYSASTSSCRDDAFRKSDHDEHQGYDGSHEREKIIDEDEVIPKGETLKLIEEFQNVDKHVPTIFDHERMEATLRDMMNNQFKDAKEYAYHLEQSKNYMENQIVWESREDDIR
ncbi:hypothetical protein Tco_0294547 [Tanacetum coccineum]